MPWKTERWLSELFPGKDSFYSEYRLLPTRELVIVAAAIIDAALAELISKRFRDFPTEAESFLGVNGDGRAPAASFGAKIQLALLFGIITQEDARVFRAIKSLRNTFAHRVQANFLTEPALGQTRTLLLHWRALSSQVSQSGALQGKEASMQEVEKYLGVHSEAGEGLVLAILSTYQAYFHLLEPLVKRINIVRRLDA